MAPYCSQACRGSLNLVDCCEVLVFVVVLTQQGPNIQLSQKLLHNKAVISLEDGRKLGHVSDLFIDPTTLSLSAFLIQGDAGQSVLPREQALSIGEDAVTVHNVSATQSGANSLPGVRLFSELHGHKVVDSAGTLIGELDDIEMDPGTGAISTVIVRSGGVFGLGVHIHRLPISDVCSFGPELITVNAEDVSPV